MNIDIIVAVRGEGEPLVFRFEDNPDGASSFIDDVYAMYRGTDQEVAVAVGVDGTPVHWHRENGHLVIDGYVH